MWPTCLRKHSDVTTVHHADGLSGPQRATDNEDAPDTRKDGHSQIIAWDSDPQLSLVVRDTSEGVSEAIVSQGSL